MALEPVFTNIVLKLRSFYFVCLFDLEPLGESQTVAKLIYTLIQILNVTLPHRKLTFAESKNAFLSEKIGSACSDVTPLHCAPTYLQLPLRQWGTGNVFLLVLSKAKR